MNRRKRTAIPWLIVGVAAVLCAGFLLYVSDYYHADDTAADALEADEVAVHQESFGWVFDGPGRDVALVFYPGGKVEETAYAPLLHTLAAQGVDTFLVRMPFHLAVFDMDAAEDVMDMYHYESWYIGGHSLGGAVAARYASKTRDRFGGIILLGAYADKPLDPELKELVIYGSEDGDGTPQITTEEQQKQTAELILETTL